MNLQARSRNAPLGPHERSEGRARCFSPRLEARLDLRGVALQSADGGRVRGRADRKNGRRACRIGLDRLQFGILAFEPRWTVEKGVRDLAAVPGQVARDEPGA